jgi:excinuclease UvrABC ATPase subunit
MKISDFYVYHKGRGFDVRCRKCNGHCKQHVDYSVQPAIKYWDCPVCKNNRLYLADLSQSSFTFKSPRTIAIDEKTYQNLLAMADGQETFISAVIERMLTGQPYMLSEDGWNDAPKVC